jgi:hypothetical protein
MRWGFMAAAWALRSAAPMPFMQPSSSVISTRIVTCYPGFERRLVFSIHGLRYNTALWQQQHKKVKR